MAGFFDQNGPVGFEFLDPGFISLDHRIAICLDQPVHQLFDFTVQLAYFILKRFLNILEEFENRAIEFRCLTEDIDTTTAMGKCMYQVRHAFSELERNLIRERTKAGMEAARQRGAHLGRPRKLSHPQIAQMRGLLQCHPGITPTQIAGQFGVSPRTIYRVLSQFTNIKEEPAINAG